MLSQKVRDKNKLYNLSNFLLNLKDKKHHMKQTTKINFA